MVKWPYNGITEWHLQQSVKLQQEDSRVNEKADTVFLWDIGGRNFLLTPLFINAG